MVIILAAICPCTDMVSLSFNFMVQERILFFQRCTTSISQCSAVILPVITFQRYPARARPALTPLFYHTKFYHSSPFHGLPSLRSWRYCVVVE